MADLVSIITPCYNGESYVGRFLESVLAQSYDEIELIFINDGSTDNTEKIVLSYQESFEKRGIKLIYISQENKGAAAAINRGLEIFNGKYLMWPDSDDIMLHNQIQKMVDFLNLNPQFGMVRVKVNIVYEENCSIVIGCKTFVNSEDSTLFDIQVFEKEGCSFIPGSYMIRTDVFIKANPKRHIYESRAGQNWQMLLPCLHLSECGYIDEPLHAYVVRQNSHSRKDISFKDWIKRYNEHEQILMHTIRSINGLDLVKYESLIRNKYHKIRTRLAWRYQRKKQFRYYFSICKKNRCLPLIEYIHLIITFVPWGMLLYHKLKKYQLWQ